MSIRRALIEAKKSTFLPHRVGAVITKGHRVLSTGYNSRQASGILGTCTRHAEASAILKLLKEKRLNDLVGATLYVTRFKRSGVVGLAKPCQECQQLIKSVGISTICFTDNFGNTIEERVS